MKKTILSLVIGLSLTACAALQHEAVPTEVAETPTTTIIEVEETIIVEDKTMADQADDGMCGTVSAQGLCGATFGMTRAQLEEAFPLPLKVSFEDPDSPDCYFMQVAEEDRGFYLMIVDDQFQRLDSYTPTIETDKGVKVGMSFGQIQRLHPDAVRQPNPYLTIFDDLVIDFDTEHRAILEQDGGEMTKSFRIGLTSAVNLIEGCS